MTSNARKPKPRPDFSVPDARTIACDILNTIEHRQCKLDSVMDETLRRIHIPDRRERALIITLVYGVLRWRNRLDWIIGQFSNTPFTRIDPAILTILRLGIFQLVFLDRIPDFAAVDGAVKLTRKQKKPHLSGFVNGVLRNVGRQQDKLELPDIQADPVKGLAVSRSFPEWLLKRWLDRYGLDDTVALCDRINDIPPVTVRVNTLKTDIRVVTKALTDEVDRIEASDVSPDALRLYGLNKAVDALTAFINGQIQVQDEAAQLVCRLLEPRPGERVLDACAGLGGKTGYLAQLMNNTGQIVAVDSEAARLERLAADMVRLGITCVETQTVDLRQVAPAKKMGTFDRVMADCPCSGLGVLRRNPDTKWSAETAVLSRLHDKQVALLHGLADRVRLGGVLMYVVCSQEPEENEDVVSEFLKIHPEFSVDKTAAQQWAETEDAGHLINQDGFFKSRPHPDNMDGFFGARLKRVLKQYTNKS